MTKKLSFDDFVRDFIGVDVKKLKEVGMFNDDAKNIQDFCGGIKRGRR